MPASLYKSPFGRIMVPEPVEGWFLSLSKGSRTGWWSSETTRWSSVPTNVGKYRDPAYRLLSFAVLSILFSQCSNLVPELVEGLEDRPLDTFLTMLEKLEDRAVVE